MGSGFAVGNGGLIISNVHGLPESNTLPAPQQAVLVLEKSSSGCSEGAQVRRATLGSVDTPRDLAQPDSVREGMDVALMGFPIGGVLGFTAVTHRDIIASITTSAPPSPTARQLDARAAAQLRQGPIEVYQLDATAYPGNSGGPVLDARTGSVLGVVNMVLVRGTRESALSHPTGITYAIPVRFVNELIQRER